MTGGKLGDSLRAGESITINASEIAAVTDVLEAGEPSRGAELEASLVSASSTLAQRALAREAGRTLDRLDELDRIIAGKGVLRLMQFRLHLSSREGTEDDPLHVKVSFDSPLAEARQQGAALAKLLESLGVDKMAAPTKPATGGTGLDEVERRRAERAEAARQARA